MSAYWVSVYQEITDEAKLAAYAELAGPAIRAGQLVEVGRGRQETVSTPKVLHWLMSPVS